MTDNGSLKEYDTDLAERTIDIDVNRRIDIAIAKYEEVLCECQRYYRKKLINYIRDMKSGKFKQDEYKIRFLHKCEEELVRVNLEIKLYEAGTHTMVVVPN